MNKARQDGAALIISVLFTMLLLLGILAVTAQLTLGSRRGTSDQRATLQAQYSAESHLALALRKIGDVQSLLSQTNLSLPLSATPTTLQNYASQFCGGATIDPPNPLTNSYKVPTCLAINSSNANQFDVFASIVQDYSLLPAAEQPAPALADRQAYWRAQLGQQITLPGIAGGADTVYTIVPEKVEQYGPAQYRFYLQLQGLTASGGNANAKRVIKAGRASNTGWYVDLAKPPYLDNVLFTNHHRQKGSTQLTPDVDFISGQSFDGPVHTNEYFRFASGATTNFSSKVTSAGCTNLAALSSLTCTQTPGVYVNAAAISPDAGLTPDQINASVLANLNAAGVNPNFPTTPAPDFQAAYRPLPINAISQASAAQGVAAPDGTAPQGQGLYFPGDVLDMQLYTGNAAGTPTPGPYDDAARKWPDAPYQYIKVQTTDTAPGYTLYRIDSSKKLEKQNSATNAWEAQPQPFNGVIYAEGAINSLSGPARLGAGTPSISQAPPALASFMKMTLAAQGNVTINSDLTLADQPCAAPACTAEGKPSPADVLGIYTQTGDITIAKSAPDLNIQGMLLSSQGQVAVQDYDQGAPMGNINLVGGLVENWYGAFGTHASNSNTPQSGYGRQFTYDQRFTDPYFTPPFFPVSPTWIPTDAAQTLNLSSIVWRQGDGS